MLADAARIQEHDCAFINKMNKRRGIHQPDVYPTYSEQDAERCMRQFVNIGYDRPIPVVPGVTLTFYDAGAIFWALRKCAWILRTGKTGGRSVSCFPGMWGGEITNYCAIPSLFRMWIFC